MNLSHYTAIDKPFVPSTNHRYSNNKIEMARFIKPVGIWVSVDGKWDWPHWCKSENYIFGLHCMKRRFKVFLKPDTQVLILKTVSEVLGFTKTFCVETKHRSTDHIHWQAVRSLFQGLIISPYQFDLRLCVDCSWYYCWDCESGCIWDVGAIERVEEDLNWDIERWVNTG